MNQYYYCHGQVSHGQGHGMYSTWYGSSHFGFGSFLLLDMRTGCLALQSHHSRHTMWQQAGMQLEAKEEEEGIYD